jgi:solute carrier family 35 protein F5
MPDHPTAHISAAYSLGLFFIVLVALIWTASSILVQYLYSDDVSFDSPFLLTYIGVSLFSLWLPTHSLWAAWASQDRHTSAGAMEMSSSSAQQSYTIVHTDGSVSSQDSTESMGEELEAGETSTTSRVTALPVWTVAEHQHAARQIAPVWFLANWAYNASLAYTSITSSTVLASTGSLFTFLFAVGCQDETFNWVKCSGVLLGLLGSILTALEDRKDGDDTDDMGRSPTAVWGDALGLLSAVGYGAYAVQTRILCPHDERRYSMQVLLGYIGLYNMVVLSPIAIYAFLSSQSSVSVLILGFVVLKGLFDNVLSDYLWLRAIMLTSATVATVGLGLTIPLAFASDILLQRSDVLTAGAVMGALAVLGGFVLVNLGSKEETSHGSDHRNDISILHNEPYSNFRDSEAVAETIDHSQLT